MASFELGQLLATPGALAAAEAVGDDLMIYARGDWGVVDDSDKRANDRALVDGTRLFSAYLLRDGATKIWIITESDRAATTILLPKEYGLARAVGQAPTSSGTQETAPVSWTPGLSIYVKAVAHESGDV